MNLLVSYRRLRAHWRCGPLLGVLGLFGALAVLCSAISPSDDDVQQEFLNSLKVPHVAATVCRTAKALPHRPYRPYVTITRPMGPLVSRRAAEATLSADPASFMAGIFDDICGLRSPPCH